MVFSAKNRKNELHYWILQILITLNTKFQLKLSSSKKGTSGLKQKKWTPWILRIRISLTTKFKLNLTILIFVQNLSKKGISRLKQKIAFLRTFIIATYYNYLLHTGSRRTQRYFNVSFPSSRWDKKSQYVLNKVVPVIWQLFSFRFQLE